jgi:hypothetical protein
VKSLSGATGSPSSLSTCASACLPGGPLQHLHRIGFHGLSDGGMAEYTVVNESMAHGCPMVSPRSAPWSSRCPCLPRGEARRPDGTALVFGGGPIGIGRDSPYAGGESTTSGGRPQRCAVRVETGRARSTTHRRSRVHRRPHRGSVPPPRSTPRRTAASRPRASLGPARRWSGIAIYGQPLETPLLTVLRGHGSGTICYAADLPGRDGTCGGGTTTPPAGWRRSPSATSSPKASRPCKRVER